MTVSSDSDGIFPSDSGVYAIYDSSGELQFVGITRNLAASVVAHKKSLPELCCTVKVSMFMGLWCVVTSQFRPHIFTRTKCINVMALADELG